MSKMAAKSSLLKLEKLRDCLGVVCTYTGADTITARINTKTQLSVIAETRCALQGMQEDDFLTGL